MAASAKVETGVSLFDGAIFSKWYGWAKRGATYREGPLRFSKTLARFDAWRLARKLGA